MFSIFCLARPMTVTIIFGLSMLISSFITMFNIWRGQKPRKFVLFLAHKNNRFAAISQLILIFVALFFALNKIIISNQLNMLIALLAMTSISLLLQAIGDHYIS